MAGRSSTPLPLTPELGPTPHEQFNSNDVEAHFTKEFETAKQVLRGNHELSILRVLQMISSTYHDLKRKMEKSPNRENVNYYWNQLLSMTNALKSSGLYHSICRLLSPTHGFTPNIQAVACDTLSTLAWKSNMHIDHRWYLEKQSLIGLAPFDMNDSSYNTILLLSYILNIDSNQLKKLFCIPNESHRNSTSSTSSNSSADDSNQRLRLIQAAVKLVWSLANKNNAIQAKMQQHAVVDHVVTIFKCAHPVTLLSGQDSIQSLTPAIAARVPELEFARKKITFANYIVINCLGALTSLLNNANICSKFMSSGGAAEEGGPGGAGGDSGSNSNSNANSREQRLNILINQLANILDAGGEMPPSILEPGEDGGNLYLILQCLRHECVQIRCMALQFVRSVCSEDRRFETVFLAGFPKIWIDFNIYKPSELGLSDAALQPNAGNADDIANDDNIDNTAGCGSESGLRVILKGLDKIANDGLRKCAFRKVSNKNAVAPQNGANGANATNAESGAKGAKADKQEIEEKEDIDVETGGSKAQPEDVSEAALLGELEGTDANDANDAVDAVEGFEGSRTVKTRNLRLSADAFYTPETKLVLRDYLECLGTLVDSNVLAQKLFVRFEGWTVLLKLIVLFDVLEHTLVSKLPHGAEAALQKAQNAAKASDASKGSKDSKKSAEAKKASEIRKIQKFQRERWVLHRSYVESILAVFAGFLLQPAQVWDARRRGGANASNSSNSSHNASAADAGAYEKHRKMMRKLIGRLTHGVTIDLFEPRSERLVSKRVEAVLVPYLVKHLVFKLNNKLHRNTVIGSIVALSVVCQPHVYENNILQVASCVSDARRELETSSASSANNAKNDANNNNNNNLQNSGKKANVFVQCLLQLFVDPCQYSHQFAGSYAPHLQLVNALKEIITCLQLDGSNVENRFNAAGTVKKVDGRDVIEIDGDESKTQQQQQQQQSQPQRQGQAQMKEEKKKELRNMLKSARLYNYLIAWVHRSEDSIKACFKDLDSNAIVYMKTECALCLSKMVRHDIESQHLMAQHFQGFHRAMRAAYEQAKWGLCAAIATIFDAACFKPLQVRNIDLISSSGLAGMIPDLSMDVQRIDKFKFPR